MLYEGSTDGYNNTLETINLGFTSVFIFELIIKLISTGPVGFWMNSWNQFDLFVVLASLTDIIFNAMGTTQLTFLRVGP